MDSVSNATQWSNKVSRNLVFVLKFHTSDSFTLLPDQIQSLNPILVLLLIPAFNYIIYPLLAKCNLLKTPLQKMTCGMFISASAFVCSGLLQLAVEKELTGNGLSSIKRSYTLYD